MTDTIASLERELKVLGPVDYSISTRQLREEIQGRIADLNATPEQRASRESADQKKAWIEAVGEAYNEESIYGSRAPYLLIALATEAWSASDDKSTATATAVAYLEANPE